MHALFSVKPRYAKWIYAGIKTVELRSVPPKKLVERIYIYETSPVKLITGFFVPGKIYEGMNARELVNKFGIQSLIGPTTLEGEEAIKSFGQRFGFTKKYSPIEIKEVIKLANTMEWSGRPPQNFCYM
jgi:predicted transcriptional regulator